MEPLCGSNGRNLLASVLSSALSGVDAFAVEVELDISAGVPSFRMGGRAEGAVREAFERMKSALRNSGFEFPNRKITVNLAPADVRKEGSAFDLPMALGVLAANGAVQKRARMGDFVVLGELALDGRVKGIKAHWRARSWRDRLDWPGCCCRARTPRRP